MKKLSAFLMSIFFLIAVGSVQAKDWKKVRIGIEGAYPPFSSIGADGKPQGFDIDIAMALCKEMGAECKLIAQDWDGIIPALLARKYDAIIASMSITEERKKKVDFTEKYYNSPAKFAVKKGTMADFTKEGTKAAIKGKTVGVQRETIFDRFLTDNYDKDVTIKRYGSQDDVYLDMLSGRLDMMMADSIAMTDGFLKKDGKDFELVGPSYSDPKWFGDGAGIAIRKGEDDLKMKFNKAIKAIRANGTYKKINDKYFKIDIY
ncbi:MAG: ABC transporter substrate-binding protein [SAR324 cluster bacterium]|nr:ABC transporter substrate-binding protein [SAR324 cluster bacterium]